MTSPTTDRRNGLVGNVAMKAPVTVLSSSNITLSGQQTIDGVAVLATNSAGVPDRVLCTAQTDATQNGIWDVSTGPWTRSKDANGNYDLVQGSTVLVNSGTANAGTYWRITTSGVITIGTTAITWALALASSLTTSTFIASGASAVSRTGQDKMRDVVSVKDYGAKGDGGTNDTAAMQAAHNTGRVVYYPTGVYSFTTLTIAKGGIIGEGVNQSILVSTDTSIADAIHFLGSDLPLFRDFQLECPPAKTTGGAALHIDAVTEIDHVTVDSLYIVNCFIGIQFTNATDASLRNTRIFNALSACVYLDNSANPDAGDCVISDCTFEISSLTGSGILHRSGAWRIFNTKILGGLISYNLAFTGTSNSSDIFIIGCSLEGATQTAIALSRASGVSNVGSIQIVGCEIGAPSGIGTDASGVVTLLVIDANNITISGATAGNVAINLLGVTHFSIGPNVLNSSGGGNSVGIEIDANCVNGKIAPQTYNGFAAANCLVNSSPSVFAQTSRQSGTASLAAANTAHGTLFKATLATTFAVAFKTAPLVSCYPGSSTAQQVSCYATNITSSGFTFTGIASSSGSVMNSNVWIADGIL